MEGVGKDALPLKPAPQQQRAHDRIEAILAATEAEVAAGGYDNLTMVSIAARAGITHTSIYRYFTSVEPILATLISRQMADFDRGVEAILTSARTVDELVEAVLKSIEFGFGLYRSKPVLRGLWAATRYLPVLRKIDDDNTEQTARLFSEQFVGARPTIVRDEIYVAMMVVASLAVPAYETALSLPKRLQKSAISNFLEMARTRLNAVVAQK
jgi:AcrR family transcriptional regulator